MIYQRQIALDKLKEASANIFGFDAEELTEDKIWGMAPENLDETSPEFKRYLSLDEASMVIFRIYVEEAFEKEVSDKNFLPIPTTPKEDLWYNRKVGDLVDYLVKEILV